MKAIRVHQFGGPEVLKLEEVPDPIPKAGEVLVRVAAAGINPFETYIRAGNYGPRSAKASLVLSPAITFTPLALSPAPTRRKHFAGRTPCIRWQLP
jgi:hypothetical protein